jgi:hypothetical protein
MELGNAKGGPHIVEPAGNSGDFCSDAPKGGICPTVRFGNMGNVAEKLVLVVEGAPVAELGTSIGGSAGAANFLHLGVVC